MNRGAPVVRGPGDTSSQSGAGLAGVASFICTVMVLAVVLSGVATPALAAPCENKPGKGNYAIFVTPNTAADHEGVRARIDVRYQRSLGSSNILVESLYIGRDGNDFVEYGWHKKKVLFFESVDIFDARMFSGDYSDRVHGQPGEGFRAFKMMYDDGAGRYDYYFENVLQGYHRDPTWKTGISMGSTESKGSCDDNNSTFHNANRKYWVGWESWVYTDWKYDSQKNWGYDYVSDTAWTISARTDDWTACNQNQAGICGFAEP